MPPKEGLQLQNSSSGEGWEDGQAPEPGCITDRMNARERAKEADMSAETGLPGETRPLSNSAEVKKTEPTWCLLESNSDNPEPGFWASMGLCSLTVKDGVNNNLWSRQDLGEH